MERDDRNTTYSFDDFLAWRINYDYYGDDDFFQKLVHLYSDIETGDIDKKLKDLSQKVSFRWRDIADEIGDPASRPTLQHYDAHNHRIDRIVRPHKLEVMEREIFSEKLFSHHTSPWQRFFSMFLIYQNGESCITCPLTCTEGLVALLSKFADTPLLKTIFMHCTEGKAGSFGIGAQYLSEIQGGSDVQANLLEAVQSEDGWHLYGNKFFCSAAHADYAVVTAKPRGSDKVGIFIVPTWLPGDNKVEIRNGHTVDRLKSKLGTCELPTAEITFQGALAYPVGPLEKGLANVVGIVLTCSRLTIGLAAAAKMTRAAREVRQYAKFRHAFGRPIEEFPMLVAQVEEIEKFARRTFAGACKVYQSFLKSSKGGDDADTIDKSEKVKESFRARELILLQKITASWDEVDILRRAISIFGGHGVMEDFSSLPRLYRDGVVNELWEGPRNVLLAQIHRDFRRASSWYSPKDCIAKILQGADKDIITEYSHKMAEFIEHTDLLKLDRETMKRCRQWDEFCHNLFHIYQDVALQESL